MSNINQQFSLKIKILSIISMISVLYEHTYFFESANWKWINLIETVINNLVRFAVPTFFIISGYLFFYGMDNYSQSFSKIRKRVRTLLIPYIIWCTLFIIIIGLASTIVPTSTDYLIHIKIKNIGIFLSFVYWEPAAFHLWFIRDLFIVIMLTPILYFVLKKTTWLIIVILTIMELSGFHVFIAQALFFFSIGGIYALKDSEPFQILPSWTGILLLIISCFIMTYYRLNTQSIWTIVLELTLTVGVWKCYDLFTLKLKPGQMLKLSEFTFAVYCAHIPLLTTIKYIIFPKIVNGAWGCFLSFIITPLICIVILIPIFNCWKKISPQSYTLFTGGR